MHYNVKYCSLQSLAADVLVNVLPMKQPNALLPLAMSVAALALVLGHIAIFGVVHEADEGTAAHLWQLLMAGQLPVVAYFADEMAPAGSRTGIARARATSRCGPRRMRPSLLVQVVMPARQLRYDSIRPVCFKTCSRTS